MKPNWKTWPKLGHRVQIFVAVTGGGVFAAILCINLWYSDDPYFTKDLWYSLIFILLYVGNLIFHIWSYEKDIEYLEISKILWGKIYGAITLISFLVVFVFFAIKSS